MISHIETVAADFISAYPEVLPQPGELKPIYLLLGSERGFCGDFNESLIKQMEEHIDANNISAPQLIATGGKLCAQLEKDPRVAAFISGVSVVEEAEKTLIQIIKFLSKLQIESEPSSLTAIYHDPDREQIITSEVLPPFEKYRTSSPQHPQPPLLNLSRKAFLTELIDHYLFAALHEILYVSSMAENLRRVRHLEGAVHHLDEKSVELKHQCNALRQEEIIEEIEVILLSSTSLDDGHYKNRASTNH
jgi:F-type H+-transporting ATPase subunit gamma